MTADEHERLLRAAQGGDRAALDHLIRTYHERVYRFGLQVCRNPVDTEDAVQDAFLSFSRSVHTFRGDSSLATWLFTLVKNACLRLVARVRGRARRLAAMTDADPPPPAPSAEESIARARVLREVQEVIAALEPGYREVIILRDVEGLSGPEVARRLGLSIDGMKTRLHRARSAVRGRLNGLVPAE